MKRRQTGPALAFQPAASDVFSIMNGTNVPLRRDGRGTAVIAAGAECFSANRAIAHMLIAQCFSTYRAQADGRGRTFDGSLTCERARHNAIAPTFGLDDQAHG